MGGSPSLAANESIAADVGTGAAFGIGCPYAPGIEGRPGSLAIVVKPAVTGGTCEAAAAPQATGTPCAVGKGGAEKALAAASAASWQRGRALVLGRDKLLVLVEAG